VESFLRTAGEFPERRKASCTLQESFRKSGKLPASRMRVSDKTESFLRTAGEFLEEIL